MKNINELDIAYRAGLEKMREEIYNLIILTDSINCDNIKDNPRLASFLLLELAEKVKQLEVKNEVWSTCRINAKNSWLYW